MRIKSETKLTGGKKLLAWWANNKGRGRNNCTLAVVDDADIRQSHSLKQKNGYAYVQTSSWNGNVNLSKKILEKLGLTKNDFIIENGE